MSGGVGGAERQLSRLGGPASVRMRAHFLAMIPRHPFLALGVGLLLTCLGCTGDFHERRRVPSPDRTFEALEYSYMWGGAPGGASTYVDIVAASSPFGTAGHNAAFGMEFGYDLTLTWQSSLHLVLAYPKGARVFLQSPSKAGVTIDYVARRCPEPSWKGELSKLKWNQSNGFRPKDCPAEGVEP